MGREKQFNGLSVTRDPRVVTKILNSAGLGLAFFFALAASHILLSRFGMDFFIYTLVGLVFGSIFVVISFRSLQVPFILLILSIGGFRFLWAIKAPILPDLYLDRMALSWVTLVFMVKFFAEGRSLRNLGSLDFLIISHGLYILVRTMTGPAAGAYFHSWSMSILIPYAVFFLAKNIVYTHKDIRNLLKFLLVISLYYSVTSIAEKFDIYWLLWPRYMIEGHSQYIGRSTGPFRNPGIFGNIMGMLLPINLYFFSTVKNLYLKGFFLFSLALGFAGLYFTYTRGSWMAGIACLAVVALLNLKQYFKIMVPLMVLVAFGAVLFLGLGQDKFMKERVENDDTIGARVGTQVTLLRVWKDYPIFGCGSFSYERIRENYIDPISVPFLGTITFRQFRGNNAHDMYLAPLAEDGLVGMGLLVAIYAIIIRKNFRRYQWRHKNDHFAILIIPLFMGIAASYLLGGVTISYRHTSILGTMFFMVAGIADGYDPEEQTHDSTGVGKL